MSSEKLNKPKAKVAIIARTKNRNLLLERAVDSVLGQTFDDWHHIVVNDGGPCASVDRLLAQYQSRYDGRLTVMHNTQSLGMEAASNKGICASESRYAVIHDDDDSWESGFLLRCVETQKKYGFDSVKGVAAHTIQIFEKIVGGEIVEERR